MKRKPKVNKHAKYHRAMMIARQIKEAKREHKNQLRQTS